MRFRKRHRTVKAKKARRLANCELLEPRLMLSATEAPVGDASFAFYDNGVAATVATDFSRDVATLDGLGNLVATDERRFGEPLQYTPTLEWNISERWEEIKQDLFPNASKLKITILGSGWDHDGQTPLTVLRTQGSTNSLVFLRGEQMEIAGTVALDGDNLFSPMAEGVRHSPSTAIVHHGLVVFASVRFDSANGLFVQEGVDFFSTQNYGQTLEQVPVVGGGFEVPAIEGDVSRGAFRLASWSFLNAFPVDGINDTESVWFPWADYIRKEYHPKGGQIGLFRADRSPTTGEWILSPNRVIDSEWHPEDSGGFHAHAAAMTTGGMISHWGDVGHRNVTKFHQFDLDDYQNATITTTDVFGGTDFTAEEYEIAPQPAATAPSPVSGEHFAAGDNTPDHLLSFGSLENIGDRLEVEAEVFQARRHSPGGVHGGAEILHLHWVQGVGYVAGGKGDSYFYFSPDGYRWTEIGSPEDRQGDLWIYGSHLLKFNGENLYSTEALPEIETVRPLQISPGGTNSIGSDLESRNEPGAGNTRRRVIYQNDQWRYADTLIPLDVQAPSPNFSSSVPVYEFTMGSGSTNLGSLWLDPIGQTQNALLPRLTDAWAVNLGDQSTFIGLANHAVGESISSSAPSLHYLISDTTQWLPTGASIQIDNSFDGEARYALNFRSYNRSPGSRFLIAIPYSGDSLAPSYPTAPQAIGGDETESIQGLGFSSEWSLGLVARWPENSQQHAIAKMPIASLMGSSGDAVEISVEYPSTSRYAYLTVDFYKADTLVHSEKILSDILRGDWLEIVISSGDNQFSYRDEINISFVLAGQPSVTRTVPISLGFSLDEFSWSARDGDTVTGIEPVLVVFDNDLAWSTGQHQEWVSQSLADKAIFQAKPAVGDFNSDGEVNAADYTVWRDTLWDTTPGRPGDLNSDGEIDFADHAIWASQFGQTGVGLIADMNGDGVVNAADYTVWGDARGPQMIAGTGADADHSGFVDQADLQIWKQAYGTHYPNLSELRAAASISHSTSQAIAPASSETTSEAVSEVTNEIDPASVVFATSPLAQSSPTSHSAYFFSSRPQETAWELLVVEESYRTRSSSATEARRIEPWGGNKKDEKEGTHRSSPIGQDVLRAYLIDEAIAVLTL